jgi:hypothetical protein
VVLRGGDRQKRERDRHKKGIPPEKQGGYFAVPGVKILLRPIKRGPVRLLLGQLREVLLAEWL